MKNKKNKPKNISKQLLNCAIFFGSSLLIEILTFYLMGFSLLPQYMLLDIAIILMIIGGVFLLPSLKAQQITFSIIIILQVGLGYLNITLYNIFGTVVTINMINLIGEATRALESSVVNVSLMLLFIAIGISYIFVNIMLAKKVKASLDTNSTNRAKFMIITSLMFIVFQLAGYSTYNNQIEVLAQTSSSQNNGFIGDDASLYNTLLFEAESLKKFGTFGFYIQDFSDTFFGKDQDKEKKILKAQEYFKSGQLSTSSNYTGVSESNNLIVIMAESLIWDGINSELTPTLYRLSQNNVKASNYYSKSKTNISEAFGILGSYPLKQSFFSMLPGVADYTENDFYYSLPNQLKGNGYSQANYFINHEKTYYKRDKTHPGFGFDNLYDISDFEVKNPEISYWGDWVLDSDFFKGAIDTIAPILEEPFFSWVTTMTAHGPYNDNYRLQSYYDEIEKSNWVNPLAGTDDEKYMRHYAATIMDLDRAVDYLINDLEQKEILDKTTIVLYSDHEAYYYDMSFKLNGIDKEDYYAPQLYNIPFIIADSNLPPMEIDKFCSPYDIMPTIMDLLGLSYNKNMYLGNSIFVEEESTNAFMSLTGGIFNDKFFTTNGVEIFNIEDEVNDQELIGFSEDIEELVQKLIIINDAYTYDVFKDFK